MPTTPPAGTIESALDGLDPCAFTQDGTVEQDEVKELQSAIGEDMAKKFSLAFPLNTDAMQAYVIGLAVARTMIAGSVELALKGVDTSKVL